jgi:AGCS family alanine or glycine:cation symporter
MMDFFAELNTTINNIVWGPPMIIAIIGIGLYVTIRTRFIQFARFGLMMRETAGKLFAKKAKAEGDVSPFKALSVAMGGTVGVGNIAGVATAIALGGPGAIFWMWISGLLGMGTKFAEVVLSVHYRKREKGGPMVGGPMVYIKEGMGKNWTFLAVIFAMFGSLAALGIGNMVQANSVADGLLPFGVPRVFTGIFLIVAVGLVTIGGIKRIANVAIVTVPFMTIIYILGALFIIVTQIGRIPEAFSLIFRHAFTPIAATGGFAGAATRYAIRYGIARGIFSNEAGLGSAPIAHATAITDHPARQGLWGIFEVFVDTIIVCSATALAIIITGAWTSGKSGAPLTMHAFQLVFGTRMGFSLVVLSMVLTAYDTILAWCFYGETCMAYLFKRGARTAYRVFWLPFTMIGALGKLEAIWAVADTLNGLMAIPNLIAILALGGVVVKRTKEFLSQKINSA